jgi:hypothetical protein
MMEIDISKSERDTILDWADAAKTRGGRYGNGDVTFPDEASLVSLLGKHDGGTIDLGHNQLTVILSWTEDAVDSRFGRGAITNVQEHEILKKIRKAHEQLVETQDVSQSEQFATRFGADTSFDTKACELKVKQKRKNYLAVLGAAVIALAIIVLLYNYHNQTSNKGGNNEIKMQSYSVEYVSGTAFLKSNGDWKNLNVGDKIFPGDSVKTGEESTVIYMSPSGKKQIKENRKVIVE